MATSSGKEMLEEAKKRTPDEFEVKVDLEAPRVYFPVRGKDGRIGRGDAAGFDGRKEGFRHTCR